MSFDREGFDKEVGLRLQLARKRREMTQEQLATQIGINRASYANVEAGRQRIPIDIVWRAAVVLGVSISSLVPESIQRGQPATLPIMSLDNAFSTSYRVSNSTSQEIPRVTKFPKS
jgi:transcriptional regulator with XRE-family HTH domain